MTGAPDDFWGKLETDPSTGRITAWHPLIAHSADVAACCEALLNRTALGQRLATLAGLPLLSGTQIARLAVLAALHDLGKYSTGFQNKALGIEPTCGHVEQVLALFQDNDGSDSDRLCQILPLDHLRAWSADPEGDACCELLVAAISHHGRPVPVGGRHQHAWWQASRGRDPFAGMHRLIEATKQWFPAAYLRDECTFPALPPLQHAFSGIVMLADWLGSDTKFFPYQEDAGGDRIQFAREQALEAIGVLHINPAGARGYFGDRRPQFADISEFEPRDAQAQLLDIPAETPGSLTLLEAETGGGKTEAAIARYLRLLHAGAVDGMYFALPTRTAATQIHSRVTAAIARAIPDDRFRPPVTLAVPGYVVTDDHSAKILPGFQVLWNDDVQERYRFRGWASENPKRYLAGAIVIGTIDQVLLSSLQVGHAHLRASALLRHLLVVDEVHASDTYMTAILREVLDYHLRAGGHALLMSATLGATARASLFSTVTSRVEAQSLGDSALTPYPLITYASVGHPVERIAVTPPDDTKRVEVDISTSMSQSATIAARAIEHGMYGAKVLVLRNTVAGCVATQREIERLAQETDARHLLFRCSHIAAPHHARFAKEDREKLDRALEESFGKASPGTARVAVATQTVQQSLDIDADLLITDLCPMDVLLQRIGRLHRHKRERPDAYRVARVVVLVPEDRDLALRIRSDGSARGPHGLGTVYDDLRLLEATWRLLEKHSTLEIPTMNRALVEAATHVEALAAIVADSGEAWLPHANRVDAIRLAHKKVANLNLVNRTVAFGEASFPSQELEGRIVTRLGEGDRIAEFADPVTTPFGSRVRKLSIPAHLTYGASDDEQPTHVQPTPEGFTFEYARRSFAYDACGLRRIDPAASTIEEETDG